MRSAAAIRSALTRLLALGLSVVIALIAALGEGLHEWQHAALDSIEGCEIAQAGQGCCEGCCLSHRSARAEEQAAAGDQIGARTKAAPSHPHDCAVCQLLTQLKQASCGLQPAVSLTRSIELSASLVDCQWRYHSIERPIARGPPSIV